MGREEEIINERLRKLDEIIKKGIEPYPHNFNKTSNSDELQKKYARLKNDERTKDSVKTAGRVMSIRILGGLAFATLQDGYGKIQIAFQDKQTPEKVFEFFKKYVDAGDFIGVSGEVFKTKRGEISILIKELKMLSKSILPLPEKWHGLTDKEERYRKRYLDLIMNPDVKKTFELREKIIDAIREFLKNKGFVEVDTPTLQSIYGGANAEPFKTKLKALDIDLFLSISPELYLKRLIVGGFEKVFTICKNFRNEGIDKWHNPEFTMMEIYEAYKDYNDMMKLFEEIYEHVCKKVFGATKFKFGDKELDFKAPWKRITMAQCLKEHVGIDVHKMSEKQLLKFAKDKRIEIKLRRKNEKQASWGELVLGLFESLCEDKIVQPTFIIDHPLESTPLCKTHRDEKYCKKLIERFEPFCMGAELGNAYSELNNPIRQRELLEEQQAKLKKGDEEANPYDSDFVNSLEIGMPPTGGVGLGIDRMIMLLTNSQSIRDIILFPFMKPEVSGNKIGEKKEEQNKTEKNKKSGKKK
jgi:lysyl-tRNA synthetase class 2